MKTDNLLILGAAGLGLYLVWKMTRPATGSTAQTLNAGGNVPRTAANSFASVMPPTSPDAWYYRDGA